MVDPDDANGGADVLRVCAVQMEHGDTLEANLSHARAMLQQAADEGAELALLPEYWFAPPPPFDPAAASEAVRDLLAEASRQLGMAVAGNVVEAPAARRGTGNAEDQDDAPLNVGLVYADGEEVLAQPKVHPMPGEAKMGVAAGDGFQAANLAGRRAGMLVCADVLYPEAARLLELAGAELLLNPVMSPYHDEDATRQAREALYVARAYDAGAFVVKAGGFRPRGAVEAMGASGASGAEREVLDVVGRSLIAAPWGLVARYADERAEELLVADLDFGKLRAVREHRSGFPKRRPGAYRGLVE